MSERHDEDLCAFLDGELDGTRSRFLLKRLSHDRELAKRWARSHLVRSVLNGERRQDLDGFHRRVSVAIQAEATPGAAPRGLPTRWLRPAAGLAVAASVALVTFAALQPTTTTPDSNPESAPAIAAPVAALVDRSEVPLNHTVSQRARVASGTRPATQALGNPRLQAYLLRHNEMAAPRATRGLVPYVYLVSAPPESAAADAEEESRDDAPTEPTQP